MLLLTVNQQFMKGFFFFFCQRVIYPNKGKWGRKRYKFKDINTNKYCFLTLAILLPRMCIIRAYRNYLRLLRWASFSPLALKEDSKHTVCSKGHSGCRFELSHVEICQALAGETGTKYEELVPSFLLGFLQNYVSPDWCDPSRYQKSYVKFVNFAIWDKFVESAARLFSSFQGEKNFARFTEVFMKYR